MGSEEFRVKLTGEVDVQSVQTSLEQKVEPKLKPVKVKVEIDETALQKRINSITGVSGLSEKNAKDSATSMESLKKGTLYAQEFQAKLQNLYETNKLSEGQFKNFSAIVSNLTDSFKNAEIGIVDFKEQLNGLNPSINSASTAFDKAKKAQTEYNLELARTQKRANMVEKQTATFQTKLNNLKETNLLTTKQFDKYSARLADINARYKDGAGETGKYQIEMNQLKNEVSETTTQMGKMGQPLTEIIAKFTKWYLVAGLVTSTIRGLKKLISVATELDASMIELGKVWDASASEMEAFKNKAYETAKIVGGTTGKAIIDATTEFKRMGYTIEESLDLAKVAAIMVNVAEGISNTSDAANILISTLKGVGASSEYAMSLLDRLNEVSNNNAVSFDALAEMLQDSAATMKILGNNVDETIGLLTGAFEILQDQKVAKGIQTIGLRIAGLNEDLEAEAGLSNQVVEALQKYANISAFDEQTGQLKSTYDILEELAGVWDQIGKNQQTALLNDLAGKRQADVAAAILSNWDSVNKAVQDAANSMGSAMDEHQKALNSVQAAQQEFQNAIQELSKALIDSGVIQWCIDFAKNIINVVTSMVEWISTAPSFVKWITAIGGTLATISVAILMLKGSLSGPAGLIAAVAAGAVAIAGWSAVCKDARTQTEALNKDIEESAKNGKDLADTFDDNEKNLTDYERSVNKLKTSIKSLNKAHQETIDLLRKEKDETEQLKKINDKLYAVEKARQELADARNKKMRVFRAGKGFVYEQDAEAVQTAQENLTKALDDLADYKYNSILDRVENFVNRLNEILAGTDPTTFLDDWASLFDEFSDLLDTDFAYILQDSEAKVIEARENLIKDLQTHEWQKEVINARQQYASETESLSKKRQSLYDITNENLPANFITNFVKDRLLTTIKRKTEGASDEEFIKLLPELIKAVQDAEKMIEASGASSSDLKYLEKKYMELLEESKNSKRIVDELEGKYGKDLLLASGFDKNASGTTNFGGGTTLVGEHGPELVSLPAGSEILSHNKSMKLNSIVSNPSAYVGSGKNMTMQFNGDLSFPNVRNANDAQGFLDALMQIGNKGLAKFS